MTVSDIGCRSFTMVNRYEAVERPMLRIVFACIFAAASLVSPRAFALTDADLQAIAQEPTKILQTQGSVFRAGDRLGVRTANGAIITRDDKNVCGEDGRWIDEAHCIRHVFVDRLARQRAYLILVLRSESRYFEWIDARTGHVTVIDGDSIHFSPSGGRFVAIWEDGLGGPVSIDVWRVGKEGPALEWRRDGLNYDVFVRKWAKPDAIELSVDAWDGMTLKTGLSARLVRTRKGWALQEPPDLPR